jgi:hypothetical protein
MLKLNELNILSTFKKQRTYLIIFVKRTTYLITLPDRSPRQKNSKRRNVTSSVRRRFAQGT